MEIQIGRFAYFGNTSAESDGVLAEITMTMDVNKSDANKNGTTQHECAGCGKPITERFLLKALDLYWHEDCLKCECCECRLGEVGSSLYTRANLILCKRDYLRLFGNKGNCAACKNYIPPYELVMKAKSNVYHLDCFACQQCLNRFCVGDRFYLRENKILCEYDYEEMLAFSNMSAQTPASLAYIKRQLPPTPTPPGQNMHPGHNPLQPHQGLGQSGQMSGGTPTVNGTAIGVGGPRAPGDMNNNGLSGPALGPVKPPPMSMQAPTS
ncbi:uncharacterized protein LOC143180849 isoform X2 [Calliopsis andreniformis]|uniref:uncharacterized protein LOC143180849 isoform X2 n=1 Tax=Calliopsis andreniformis TaxID=337506 RepID=UPI003FCC776A